MPFTTNMTGVANVDDSIIEEFDSLFIVEQEQQGVMDQFVSYQRQINAKSIEFPKYASLAPATTPLTEDEDVVSTALSDSKIIFTPAEYGLSVTRTFLSSFQTGGKVDRAAAELVGENAGRTLDRLAILAAEASANQNFADGVADADSLGASNVMDTELLNQLYNKLARKNIRPLSEGMYVAVMHDDQIADLRNSAGSGSWQDINKYARPEEVLMNEVGMLAGFRIVRDNNITITSSALRNTYKCLAMGFNALGKAEAGPMSLRLSGPYDKLNRFVNVGWHWLGQYGLVDTDAIELGVSASSFN